MCQLCSAPLSLRAVSHGVLLPDSLNSWTFASQKFRVLTLLFSWPRSLRAANSSSAWSCSLQWASVESCAGLTAGLKDPKGLFQPKQFYDYMKFLPKVVRHQSYQSSWNLQPVPGAAADVFVEEVLQPSTDLMGLYFSWAAGKSAGQSFKAILWDSGDKQGLFKLRKDNFRR